MQVQKIKNIDTSVIDKYAKVMQENELSTNSAYPQIEIIREIDTIKNLKNKELENNDSEQKEENDKIKVEEIKEEDNVQV